MEHFYRVFYIVFEADLDEFCLGLNPGTEYSANVIAHAGLMSSLPSSVNFATGK